MEGGNAELVMKEKPLLSLETSPARTRFKICKQFQFSTSPNTGLKRDSLKRGDSSRNLKGVSIRNWILSLYVIENHSRFRDKNIAFSFAPQEDLCDCRDERNI